MKSHAYFEALLAIHRDLNEAERREVEAHIQGCSGCAARLADYQRMDYLLTHLAQPRPDTRLRREFYTALGTQSSPLGWLRQGLAQLSTLVVPVLQVAAAMLLIAVLWLVMRGQLESPQPAALTTDTIEAVPVPSEDRPIYLLTSKDNLSQEINRSLLDQFAAQQDRFEVVQETLNLSSVDITLAMDSPTDVVTWQSNGNLPILAGDGLLRDISHLWADQGWSEQYPEPFQSLGQIDGKTYILPTTYAWFAIYYHRPTFERYNLTPPQTWADLLTVAETLKKQGVTPIIHPNPQVWPALVWFDYLDMRLNGPEFHQRLLEGQERFDTMEVKRVFEMWQTLLERDYFAHDLAFSNLEDAAQQMLNGRAAMILTTPDILETVPAAQRDEFDFFPVPVIDPSIPPAENVLIEGYFISANTTAPTEAEALLAYLGSTEAQRYVSQTFGPRLNHIPIHQRADLSQLSPQAQRGRELVENAAAILPHSYKKNLYRIDLVSHIEAAINKFLTNPDNIDSILVALEELRKAVNASK